MSSFTFSDNKLGGRLMAACDALAAGKLRTAAGIFNDVAGELNVEAEATDGLLADEPEQKGVGFLAAEQPAEPVPQVKGATIDMTMCSRNVHQYGAPAPVTGWRTCQICGSVNVAPPNDGPYDMSARNA